MEYWMFQKEPLFQYSDTLLEAIST